MQSPSASPVSRLLRQATKTFSRRPTPLEREQQALEAKDMSSPTQVDEDVGKAAVVDAEPHTVDDFEEPLDNQERPLIQLRSVGHVSLEGSTGHANEDRFVIKSNDHFHMFAVMDGHGGDMAANFLVDKLFATLETVYQSHNGFDHAALTAAIEDLDRVFLNKARRLHDYSGACLLIVLLYYDAAEECYQELVLNTGDCRAIVREAPERRSLSGRKLRDDTSDTTVVALSEDHCAKNRAERIRALEAGAYIQNGRIAGILEPFRSIGDLDMKSKGMEGWVIPTPEIRQRDLQIGQSTFVLATDGVWSVMSSRRAIAIAHQELTEDGDAQSAAEAIAEEAVELGSLDDVTVLVVSV
ncbi:hypothetical protein Poli38472_006816 [Pythium oligandrum]|uniref:PPM-type phosphatase domain-containing protein n=1 Tax=Pythium oligandrum TaxID=41045 RepID=A0A8K1FC48_PYTOL|nr:hypothetical protein Poli38472_006816 [Pythium oligandrum]|eukprot:TMW56806.1 hypothetical protein Poli38472_006816 [Pythium oligandrum]